MMSLSFPALPCIRPTLRPEYLLDVTFDVFGETQFEQAGNTAFFQSLHDLASTSSIQGALSRGNTLASI